MIVKPRAELRSRGAEGDLDDALRRGDLEDARHHAPANLLLVLAVGTVLRQGPLLADGTDEESRVGAAEDQQVADVGFAAQKAACEMRYPM